MDSLEASYQFCEAIAKRHYENFPVASFLLPKRLRRPIAVIYAFARTADDYADEGDFTKAERLRHLQALELGLNKYNEQNGHYKYIGHNEQIEHNNIDTDIDTDTNTDKTKRHILTALQAVIKQFNLPLHLFYDLLSAFKQDVTQNRYPHFDDILLYCKHSAHPIGQLLLHLTNQYSEENALLSDKICAGLQLINFIQDLKEDLLLRDRCYIPLSELNAHQVSLESLKDHAIKSRDNNRNSNSSSDSDSSDNSSNKNSLILINDLIQIQLRRAREIFEAGAGLSHNLKGPLKLELKIILQGGYAILDKLEQRKCVYKRPILKKLDVLKLLWYSIAK